MGQDIFSIKHKIFTSNNKFSTEMDLHINYVIKKLCLKSLKYITSVTVIHKQLLKLIY